MTGKTTKKTAIIAIMTNGTILIAVLVPVESDRRILDNTNTMTTIITVPVISQLQEKMSNNARAQRRVLMEPIPSHTNAAARIP